MAQSTYGKWRVLNMATMDIIKLYEKEPAFFRCCRGATKEKVSSVKLIYRIKMLVT